MDRRERYPDLMETLKAAAEAEASELWTALPCVVQSFNAALQTCAAKPALSVRQTNPDGTTRWLSIPLLVDVPVVFPSGGGYTLTFPVVAGDEALVVFSMLCIDSWWTQGGVDNLLPDLRMHNLSDGFALLSPRSRPRALTGVSVAGCELRSDDGETLVQLSPGKIQLIADEVVIHGRNKTSFDAGGTGFVYRPARIDTYTNGVASFTHLPDPPGPLP